MENPYLDQLVAQLEEKERVEALAFNKEEFCKYYCQYHGVLYTLAEWLPDKPKKILLGMLRALDMMCSCPVK